MQSLTGSILVFLLATCLAKDISRQTLDELEILLKQFKKSTSERSEHVEEKVSPEKYNTLVDITDSFITDPKKTKCASKCRASFGECMISSEHVHEKERCADLFVSCYPKCFYGFKKQAKSPDLFICRGTCLRNYDQCVFSSENKAEQLSCYYTRKPCFEECPKGSSSLFKKACGECDADYTMCEEQSRGPFEKFQCGGARGQCRRKYC